MGHLDLAPLGTILTRKAERGTVRELPGLILAFDADRAVPRSALRVPRSDSSPFPTGVHRNHLPRIDPLRRIEAYRQTIRVDYACELAHQKLSAVARGLARQQRESR